MPIALSAFTRSRVSDSCFDKLAIEMSMPQLLDIDEPTHGATRLSIAEAEGFMSWLRSTQWGTRLAEDLQCIANDNEGRPLLTSWLSCDEFRQLVTDAQSEPFGLSLHRAYAAWTALGATSVYFDSYRSIAADERVCD